MSKIFDPTGSLKYNDPANLLQKPQLARKDKVEDAREKLEKLEAFKEEHEKAKFYFYNVWLSQSPTTNYDWIEVTGPSYLVEVFMYSSKEETADKEILDILDLNEDLPIIFPVGKIIAVGDGFAENQEVYKRGDIVRLPNDVCYVEHNQAWLEYKEKMAFAKPTPNMMAPPRFRGKLLDWNLKFRVVPDITNPYDDNGKVFELPAGIIRGKVKIDELKKSQVG